MIKQLFANILRDKKKWILFFVALFLYKIIVISLLKFLLTNLNIKTPILIAIILLNTIPVLSIGVFVYWAGAIKIELKKLSPWFIWGIFAIAATFMVSILSMTLMNIFAKAFSADYSYPLFTMSVITHIRMIAVVSYIVKFIISVALTFPLFAFMMSVWGESSFIKGISNTFKYFGKFVLFLICWEIASGKYLIKASDINEVLNAIVIYLFYIGLGKTIKNENTSSQSKTVSSNIKSMPGVASKENSVKGSLKKEQIEHFFQLILNRDIDNIKKELSKDSRFAKVSWQANGNTPLHVAAWNNWGDIAQIILSIDNTTRYTENTEGKCPYELAESRGYFDLAEILK